LNVKYFRYLHFISEETNLKIELPQNHRWVNGLETNDKGSSFICNMPTEEIYTTPLKKGVNGIVKNTKPLVYEGQIIDQFTLTFKDGEIIDFFAEKGMDALQNILQKDEGARYIGEVALVPHDSAISASNLLFYHNLFDENASSHLAIGQAYTSGLKEDGANLENINNSMIHIDFMIGSQNLQVNGIREDSTAEAILVNGEWVIK